VNCKLLFWRRGLRSQARNIGMKFCYRCIAPRWVEPWDWKKAPSLIYLAMEI